jgi:hypothetical protein
MIPNPKYRAGPHRLLYVSAGLVGVVIAIVLVVGSVYPSPPSRSNYSSEVAPLSVPGCPGGQGGSALSYVFDSAVFNLQVFNWCSPFGATLTANGTEPNGQSFSIEITTSLVINNDTVHYSPDQVVGVAWAGSPQATLLVRK